MRSLLAFLFAPYSTMIIIITRRRTTTEQHSSLASIATQQRMISNGTKHVVLTINLICVCRCWNTAQVMPTPFLSFFLSSVFFSLFVSFFHLFSMRKDALFTCILVGRMIQNILVVPPRCAHSMENRKWYISTMDRKHSHTSTHNTTTFQMPDLSRTLHFHFTPPYKHRIEHVISAYVCSVNIDATHIVR